MKKFALYILILIILVGLFSPTTNARAQTAGKPQCYQSNGVPIPLSAIGSPALCTSPNIWSTTPPVSNFSALGGTAPQQVAQPAVTQNNTNSEFQSQIDKKVCFSWDGGLSIYGCITQFFYYIFYVIPTFILWLCAYFFNVLISITINSTLFTATFVGESWKIVRDLSNIFFILILLYIAIKVILGLGGHEVKKMIVQVILMALLINFSMFFTKIVIDASNILALVFYNKINVETKLNGQIRPYIPITGEKDVAGGMVTAFDPTRLLTEDFFNKTKIIDIPGYPPITGEVPPSILIGITLLAGVLMLFAAYCFFVSGISFLGRLIELLVLIIFSPFAFMSSSISLLEHLEYIGWDAWLKRLLSVSFMAPIFMFFLYFIFRIVGAKIFDGMITQNNHGVIETILLIVIPAMIILTLLLKATEFAKKGAGKFGEMAMGAIKMGTVLGAGVTGLGLALVGKNVIARSTAAASRTEGAIHYGKARIEHNQALERWEHGGRRGAKPSWADTATRYEANNPGVKIQSFNPLTAIGGRINYAQSKSGEIDHARHEIDEAKKKAGLEGVGDKFLSGVEQQKIETTFIKENRTQIETDIKRGYDAKNNEVPIIKDINGNEINAKGESDYKQKRRQAIIRETQIEDPGSVNAGELTDQGRKKVEDKLNSEFSLILKNLAPTIGKSRFEHLQGEAKQKVGMATRIASRSTSGTYDIRNLSSLATDRREGIGAKATIGIVAAVATGIRAGLKKGAGVEIGSPQGSFLKDIGQTITESLKHAKIDLKFESGGGGAKHGPSAHAHAPDDHGGGHAPAGGGHGGGGHH